MNKFNRRRSRGFTLVELLIVIIIIGILAGSMMLVAGSGTDKAKATKIVSDMRTMKSAALMYYADNDVWPADGEDADVLASYLDRDTDSDSGVITYTFSENASNDLFLVGTFVTMESGVLAKLVQMAPKDGIYGTTAEAALDTSSTTACMKIK